MNSQTFFSQICSINNLKTAYYKASKRKRSYNSYLYFKQNQEVNLQNIHSLLLSGTWQCGKYKQFKITDPKERLISAAPFKDRIVHHAIINILEPAFEKKMIFHSYACRKQKGTHAAINFAQKKCLKNLFFLKLDVKKYFDSIDHKILRDLLLCLTNESKVQWLLGQIIDSYQTENNKGMPIGNLTSQYFANLYLSGMDHYVLEVLKPVAYIRYMDDMLIFAKDVEKLKHVYEEMNRYIQNNLLLNFKTPVYGRCDCGIPFLGKLITRNTIKPLSAKRRLKKKKIKKIDYLVRHNKITQEKGAERINAIINS